ncbi:hypothetical protein F0365_03620 [Nonlabens sp. Ci31]|uniref:hypothetical protein n=1 Tax=Nonlabens sp. Ci31 TaxID=2608253 RepID=UPI00146306E6|nr:hypothetical protein [Nonlabens sp. Ci31]QJP33560.1 hypothetical protein F0365_03620 [Nonlabens sp. Ci31]
MKKLLFIILVFMCSYSNSQESADIKNFSIDGVDIAQIQKDSLSQLFGLNSICKNDKIFETSYSVFSLNKNSFWFSYSDSLSRIETINTKSLVSIDNIEFSIGDSLNILINQFKNSMNITDEGINYLLFDILNSSIISNSDHSDSFIEIEYTGASNLVTSITYYTFL